MKNYVAINDSILKEWETSSQKYGEHNFAPDGIMYRGEILAYGDGAGIEREPDEHNIENTNWANAPLRILFLTKDQNSAGETAWDVRTETGRKSVDAESIPYLFYRNLMYQLYGLVKTTSNFKPDYTFSNKEAVELYDSFPLARINAKKESGANSVSNSTLRKYLERDSDLISRQIDNLDADIIVCCGFSESIEESGNLLLNFLNHHGYNFIQIENNTWMYYDAEKNKLAINNWHLSYRYIGSEKIYNKMIDAYYQFLQIYPDFIKHHR